MTERDRPGTYNPFEDTGDWPFRESTAPPVQAPGEEGPSLFDREAVEHGEPEPDEPFRLEEQRPEPVVELAEPAPDVPVEIEDTPEAALEPEPQSSSWAAPAKVDEEEAPLAPEQDAEPEPDESEPAEPAAEAADMVPVAERVREHAPGDLEIPEGPELLEGAPNGFRRTVAVVVSRFNADVTNRLLENAIEALVDAHVTRESITVVPVPGAFELPLAAMALAKTRRFSCVIALGCVIRGETPHFDFVAGEAASGLQLAAIETGVPVSFGLLTCETKAQAEARTGKGAEAARAALEMADLFTQVRTRAARAG